MQIKEEKICTFTQKKGKRIQMLKITKQYTAEEYTSKFEWSGIDLIKKEWKKEKYQIRINRKIISNHESYYQANRKLTSIITAELLQTKFTF